MGGGKGGSEAGKIDLTNLKPFLDPISALQGEFERLAKNNPYGCWHF